MNENFIKQKKTINEKVQFDNPRQSWRRITINPGS